MQNEDQDFFVLVAGVLAAVVLITSWWFASGGVAETTPTIATPPISAEESGADDSDGDGVDGADGEVEDDTTDEAETGEGASDGDASDGEADGEDGPKPEPEPVVVAATVVEAIADRDDLTVVAELLARNDLDDLIGTQGEWTVFAPTNDAITSASADDTVLALLESSPVAVLGYHVLSGDYSPADLESLVSADEPVELATLQGEPITLSINGSEVRVNDIVIDPEAALRTGTGTVYVLDDLLVPPVTALNTLAAREPILFAPGSASVDAASIPTLDRFVSVLERSETSVLIGGHTDNTGDPLANRILSQDRARAVLNYLVANGIDEARLTAEGFGDSEPVADNATEEGRARNRRIDFTPG